jgi:uncharacterized lipoprotein YajG
MMRAVLPVFAATVFLTACASEPRVVSATPPGVSYHFLGENIAEATARADRYCQQYGKRARLQAVNRTATDNIAAYECL